MDILYTPGMDLGGGCRPATAEELALAPQFEGSALQASLAATAPNTTTWLADYEARFKGKEQDGAGPCTCFATAGAGQWAHYKTGGPAIDLSGTFVYAQRPNFPVDAGWYVSGAMDEAARSGICTDALWTDNLGKSAEEVQQHITAKPPPAAYADALNRRVLDWASIPLNFDNFKACIAAGYPITFGVGAHAMFFIDYRNGDDINTIQFTAVNSHLRADGHSETVGFTWPQMQSCFDFCVLRSINKSGSTPPPGNQMALDEIDAARAALHLGSITQPQIDAGKTAWAKLVPDAVTPPPPPPPPAAGDWTLAKPGDTGTDASGAVWSLGTVDRWGYRILRNGVDTGAGAPVQQKSGVVYTKADHWYKWKGTWLDSAAP